MLLDIAFGNSLPVGRLDVGQINPQQLGVFTCRICDLDLGFLGHFGWRLHALQVLGLAKLLGRGSDLFLGHLDLRFVNRTALS